MKYVVAVSGGVDSVVLLDLMVRARQDIVVAHFDHGIREDSADDARFVGALADRCGVDIEMLREELGLGASEETARDRRYDFLHRMTKKHNGQLVTAHHQDDVIETVAHNLKRGSRWRGLTGLGDQRILRPLTEWTKHDIYNYATKHRLEWCEDSTNQSDRYTRNRLRRLVGQELSSDARAKIYELWRHQHQLRSAIEQEAANHREYALSRYFLTHIDQAVAEELLYLTVLEATGQSLLTSQLRHLLIAIKTARPGTVHPVCSHWRVKFGLRDVTIERVE